LAVQGCCFYKYKMNETIYNIESIAVRFNPAVLVPLGIVLTIAGLFVWLGGFGMRKALMATAGAIAGAICAVSIFGANAIITAVAVIAAATLAVMLKRTFTAIIAAAFVIVIGSVIAITYGGESLGQLININSETIPAGTQVLSVSQSIGIIKTFTRNIVDALGIYWPYIPTRSRVIIAAAAVFCAGAGFYFWRVACSLCCAAIGVISIFAGMIALLWYKSCEPLAYVNQRPLYYLAIFATMVAFGTTVQFVLFPLWKKDAAVPRKKSNPKLQDTQEEPAPNWRNV